MQPFCQKILGIFHYNEYLLENSSLYQELKRYYRGKD